VSSSEAPLVRDLTPRVLAGSPALDRRVFPRPGSVARWFEPFHVRQPQVARGEITAQVLAGADIVVAPSWLTHRRAREGVGESRRARAWTTAAVRLAREAVEVGLERREGDPRPVLVAGPLPDVSAGPEHATGRLLPGSGSGERDIHDQAGILADTEVDLLLLEHRASFEAALEATRVAVDAGRPVWTSMRLADGPGEPPLADRLAMLVTAGAAGVLVEPAATPDRARLLEPLASLAAGPSIPVGLVAETPPLAATDDTIDAWLAAGVRVLGLASGADPKALRPLVEARERLLAAAREREDAERTSLESWVLDAAMRAPGGRALWLGAARAPMPSGFGWTVLDASEMSGLATLPGETFRLVIAVADIEPGRLEGLVERGGIVAIESGDDEGAPGRLGAAGLRIQAIARSADGRLRRIYRREYD
jgi:S-methylmethionine-dependent homocysteine/selenocysteine methylase